MSDAEHEAFARWIRAVRPSLSSVDDDLLVQMYFDRWEAWQARGAYEREHHRCRVFLPPAPFTMPDEPDYSDPAVVAAYEDALSLQESSEAKHPEAPPLAGCEQEGRDA